MRSRVLPLLAVAALVLASPASAKDEAKAACKTDCRTTMQACKQDCQVDRDSGDQQESGRYRDCDQSCHDAYAGCTSACETQ
jgi:hypothetical protein